MVSILRPVYPENPADVADMSNPHGHGRLVYKKKSLRLASSAAISPADAYSLQPARIVNGEGYYNLYGADNQYLVTINAKTAGLKEMPQEMAGR
jgi:5-formyltetrahydrofolate cyclo-ligase